MHRPRTRYVAPRDRAFKNQLQATLAPRTSEPTACSLTSITTPLRRPIAPLLSALVLIVAFAMGSAASAADDRGAFDARASKSLDEQVQEIKSDVLAIAAELGNLEERLLFPSNTQVAVFVALEAGDEVALTGARISIDGELAAHHIYSFEEIEALTKGGVQRIYTGNVPTGNHRLEVSISGKRGSGKDFELKEDFSFSKEVDPKLVGITLGSGPTGNTTIAIEDW